MLEGRNFPKKNVSLQQSQGNFSCTRMGGGCIVCMQMTDHPAQDQRYNSLVRPVVPFPFRVSSFLSPPCEESGLETEARITVVVLMAVEDESLMAPTCAVLLATRHGLTAAWKHAWNGRDLAEMAEMPKLQVFPKILCDHVQCSAWHYPFVKNEATVVKNDWCC